MKVKFLSTSNTNPQKNIFPAISPRQKRSQNLQSKMHTPSFIKYRTYIQTLTEIKPKFKSRTNTITNSFPKNVKTYFKNKKRMRTN